MVVHPRQLSSTTILNVLNKILDFKKEAESKRVNSLMKLFHHQSDTCMVNRIVLFLFC